MSHECPFTGKRTRVGRALVHRGKPKYLGGVGIKTTGRTKRKFRPNIQRVRAVIDGAVVRINVSTKAIKMGFITKPLKRDYVAPAKAGE